MMVIGDMRGWCWEGIAMLVRVRVISTCACTRVRVCAGVVWGMGDCGVGWSVGWGVWWSSGSGGRKLSTRIRSFVFTH